jgi:predicted trehalose synthase
MIYGNLLYLKLYRRLEEGINPDMEVVRFLPRRGFPNIPPFAGAIEYRKTGSGPDGHRTVAGCVANQGMPGVTH